MTRTPARLAVLIIAITTVAGCGSLTDDDVAVRVGSADLSQHDFEQILRTRMAAAGAFDTHRANREQIGEVISTFVITELVRAELTSRGITVTPREQGPDETRAAALDREYSFMLESWEKALPSAADDEIQAQYELGPADGGLVCLQRILSPTFVESMNSYARIDAGERFGDVAFATSADVDSAGNGGLLGCTTTGRFRLTFPESIVDAALATELGETTTPVETESGFHLLRLVPFDELSPSSIGFLRIERLAATLEIEVDPRYGTWSLDTGLDPLGG